MIETGNLSEFNDTRKRNISSCNDAKIVAILSENRDRFPNIYSLLTSFTLKISLTYRNILNEKSDLLYLKHRVVYL